MKKRHQREGEKAQEPVQLANVDIADVFQPVDPDAIHILPERHFLPVQIFIGVTAEGIHGVTRFLQRHRRVIRQGGRRNILRIKVLAQEQNIPFLLHA